MLDNWEWGNENFVEKDGNFDRDIILVDRNISKKSGRTSKRRFKGKGCRVIMVLAPMIIIVLIILLILNATVFT